MESPKNIPKMKLIKRAALIKETFHKEAKSVKAEVIQFIAKQDLHPNYVCLYCASYKPTRKHFILNNFINRSF